MKYGKERPYRKITSRNLMRTADVLGIPRGVFVTNLSTMSRMLPDAVRGAIDDVPTSMVTPQLRAMPTRIRSFADGFVEQIQRDDLSYRNLPRFEGGHATGRPATSRVWEPGEWRAGRWVTGHYRGRSGR